MPRENNRIKNRIDQQAQYHPDSAMPDFPECILVEISNLCNHKCVFCAYPKMTRPGRRIDLDLLDRLLREAYDLGAREAGFYSGAEPFMSPDLEKIIKLAKSIGYTYAFTSTNGSLATPERLRTCFDNGLDSIKFSINGGDRETYKKIHGRDHFDRVLANLKFASEYRDAKQLDYYIAVSFVLIDNEAASNVATKDQLSSLAGPYADEVLFIEACSENAQMIGLAPMEIKAPCGLPFSRFHVSAEGYLRMCCNDYQSYLSLIDLNSTTLKNAWHAEIFQEMRQRHLENRLEGTLCYNCVHNVNTPISPVVPHLAVKVEQDFFVFNPPKKS